MITNVPLPLCKDWIVKMCVFCKSEMHKLYGGPFCLFSSLLLSEELPQLSGRYFKTLDLYPADARRANNLATPRLIINGTS